MIEQPKKSEGSFNPENSPLEEAYHLLEAKTPIEMEHNYTALDQSLMKSGGWDYNNPELLINKVKDILEQSDLNPLTEEELEWRQEILWFWYHHAISCAIWRYKDRSKALEMARLALEYKSPENPNKITQLLWFLINDQLDEARRWADKIKDEVEKNTADELITEYEEGKFF